WRPSDSCSVTTYRPCSWRRRSRACSSGRSARPSTRSSRHRSKCGPRPWEKRIERTGRSARRNRPRGGRSRPNDCVYEIVVVASPTVRGRRLRYPERMKRLSFTRRDAVRGGVAGAEAVASRAAAQVLFETGGRKVLPAALQRALRGAVERETSRVLAG